MVPMGYVIFAQFMEFDRLDGHSDIEGCAEVSMKFLTVLGYNAR